MAIGHISIRPHSRGKGHSAAAALAYRHGERLVNCRTGEIHDYRHRRRPRADEVAAHGVVSSHREPPPWAGRRDPAGREFLQALADRIEQTEKHPRACLLRDVNMALPCELSENEQRQLSERFAQQLAKRYSTLVTWAVHRPVPGKGSNRDEGEPDPRNVHAHIVLPTRTLDAQGAFGPKLRVLDTFLTEGPTEIATLRALWEETANAALKAAGQTARVHVGRRLDAPPEPTAPWGVGRGTRAAYRRKRAAHRKRYAGRTPVYAPASAMLATVRDWSLERAQAIARRLQQQYAELLRLKKKIIEDRAQRLEENQKALRQRHEARLERERNAAPEPPVAAKRKDEPGPELF